MVFPLIVYLIMMMIWIKNDGDGYDNHENNDDYYADISFYDDNDEGHDNGDDDGGDDDDDGDDGNDWIDSLTSCLFQCMAKTFLQSSNNL